MKLTLKFSSVQFSHSVMSNSLWPHGPQHFRPPCLSPAPGVCSNSSWLSWWCHPIISSSVVPFSSAFNLSENQGLFKWIRSSHQVSKVLRVSASTSVLPMNIQWISNEYSGLISFRMHWMDLLAVQGTLKSLLQYYTSKPSILRHSAFFIVQLSHPYMTTGKPIALTRRISVGKVMALLFNMLSRLVITFLPRSKRILISWLQSPSAVT